MILDLFVKSGPFTCFINSFVVDFGFSSTWQQASITSEILWDGISVAMPTAIPVVPLRRILGTFEGKIVGSNKEPSKLGCHATVPNLSSSNNKFANAVSLDSVYLIAANDLGSSWVPQLPWPSTNGYLNEKLCAIRTIAS